MTRRLLPLAALLASTVFLLACPDSPTKPEPPACTYSVAPASLVFDPPGGTATVTVATTAGCTWTAASGAAWLSITSGSTGTGPGSVALRAAPNAETSTRTTTATIAGQSLQVSQAGVTPCTYSFSPTSATVFDDAGDGSFAVTTEATCLWTAVSDAGWLTITSATGQGSGDVRYAFARNEATTSRVAHVTVAGEVFTLTQMGDSGEPTVCDYSVAPVEFSACLLPQSFQATLTTQAGCTWTATSSVPWISVVDAASSGAGPVRFQITEPNYDAPRSGIVMVRWPTATAGQNLQVHQAGCLYAVTQSTFSFASTGGTDHFDVLQQSEPNECGGPLQNACVWSAVADVPWITVTTAMPRAGDDRVNFTVAPNGTGATRVGHITVRDKTVVVQQGG